MRSFFIGFFLFGGLLSQAQNCIEDGHSVNINDSWVSCELAPNPNPERGESHWVLYDLGYLYHLGTSHFWNYNVEGATDQGMRHITIDGSTNGVDWTEIGTFELPVAPGTGDYQGEPGLDFGAFTTRYVLITATDTWGGDCAGLSEVRFDITGPVSTEEWRENNQALRVYPNPADQVIFLESSADIREFVITNATGQEIVRSAFVPQFDISYLAEGLYFVKALNQANEVFTHRFVKQGVDR
ncbi:MAG: T9SS type A sorting domain-containing protein [Bacteroidota bacterium]